MQARGSREQEARDYLEKHRIMELLNYLTSTLLFFRPGKSLSHRSAFCPTASASRRGAVARNYQYIHPSASARPPAGSSLQYPHLHAHTLPYISAT